MNIGDHGFRSLYRHFVLIQGDERMAEAAAAFDIPDGYDAYLAYPYVDTNAGMHFRVLAPARFDTGELADALDGDEPLDFRFLLTVNREARVLDPADKNLEPFADAVARLDEEFGGEDIDAVRALPEIDDLRYPAVPDDIIVQLLSSADQPERVWVKTRGLDGAFIKGTLMVEPYGFFGVHKGADIEAVLLNVGTSVVAGCMLDAKRVGSE